MDTLHGGVRLSDFIVNRRSIVHFLLLNSLARESDKFENGLLVDVCGNVAWNE